VEAAFRGLASDLAGDLDLATLDKLSTPDRLARVAEFLTARGYLARWENDEDRGGFLLHKCNCPYADVAEEHPELCIMDQTLINRLLGEPCTRTQSMADDARCCTYRVQDRVQGAMTCDAEAKQPGHEHGVHKHGVAGPQRIELQVTV
jgi:predicted ArsR family transcriptional regulator